MCAVPAGIHGPAACPRCHSRLRDYEYDPDYLTCLNCGPIFIGTPLPPPTGRYREMVYDTGRKTPAGVR